MALNGFALGGAADVIGENNRLAVQQSGQDQNYDLGRRRLEIDQQGEQNRQRRELLTRADKERANLMSAANETIEALKLHGVDNNTIAQKVQPLIQAAKSLAKSSGVDPTTIDAQLAASLAKPGFDPNSVSGQRTAQASGSSSVSVPPVNLTDPRNDITSIDYGNGNVEIPAAKPQSATFSDRFEATNTKTPQKPQDDVERFTQALLNLPPNATPAMKEALKARLDSAIKLRDRGGDVSGLEGDTLRDALAKRGGLTPEQLDVGAAQLNAGNTSVLTNLGRGNQGGEAVKALRAWAAHKLIHEEGLSPQEAAERVNANTAEYRAMQSGASALGRREAQVIGAATTAVQTAPRVLEASALVDRTRYPALNAVLLAAKQGTGDENVVRFGIAVNTFINNYARALGAGNAAITDSARREAFENLNKAWSKGQISAAIDQMLNKELPSEITGAKMGLREFLKSKRGQAEDATSTPSGNKTSTGVHWSIEK